MSYCEFPEFYNESFPKAKKQHRCCECYAPIEIGEEHLYYRGKWDGDFDSGRQHMLCREICMLLNLEHRDECFAFGDLNQYWADCGFSEKRWLRRCTDPKHLKDAVEARHLMARVRWRERKHRPYGRLKVVDGQKMRRKWGQPWATF